MEKYEVKCPNINTEISPLEVSVPGSKSITNRALLLAAMANGESTLRGCLTSEDAYHFLECLKTLGFPVKECLDHKLGSTITITGFGGEIPNKKTKIYVGSAGTAARFLVAMLAFSDGEYIVTSSEQMKKRPMQPLIDSLRNAGATVTCLEKEGHFPLQIIGTKNTSKIPDIITVNIDKSSQFLSALLIAWGTLNKKATIQVVGSHGLSYVDMTAQMMKTFGINVEKMIMNENIFYNFFGEGSYQSITYDIEPDMSAAAYFYALAAILGIKVSVHGVTSHMLQGDVEFLHVLENMGCELTNDEKDTICIKGPEKGALKGGFTIDMSSFSDQALTLAAIAPFADAPITITGIGHIRLQECDRIKAIINNLTSLGIKTKEHADTIVIYPGQPKGCEIETYEDHRVAMSFALTGLRTNGVIIQNPSCCKKTFAEYFTVLDDILQKIDTANN